ncbi:MAG: hypothetical protein AAF485_25025, partial [Chloroflexota bacterium]
MESVSINPYVGPRTFTRHERGRFFGRKREAIELFSLVNSKRLTLFYAESGAGKSSLINASLIPQLQEAEFAVLPTARVSGTIPDTVDDIDNIYIFNLMLSLDQRADLQSSSDLSQLANLTLTDFLKNLVSPDGEFYYYDSEAAMDAEVIEAADDVHYILIIDQFEEIITTYPDRWTERADFFEQLGEAMNADPNLWVLLTLREDYLAALDSYAHLVPDRLRARFYMERLDYRQALQAIERPAKDAGRPFAAGVAQLLVDNLRQLRSATDEAQRKLGQYVEPVQLQVVCYQLWENLKDRPLAEITTVDLAELGDVEMAMADYYEMTIQEVLTRTESSEMQLRDWFDQILNAAANSGGAIKRGEDETAGLPNDVVDLFVTQFLLRSKNRSGEVWYELVHDRFIEPILQTNVTWWLTQGQAVSQISQDDVEQLGDVNTALSTFYEQVIAETLAETGTSEINLRNWFDQELITEAKTRGTVYQGQSHTGSLPNTVVEVLASQFLLRPEIRAGGTWYELVHDRFIEPIIIANQSWWDRQNPLIRTAQEWLDAGKPKGLLYLGEQLQTAQEAMITAEIEPLVLDFLAAGKAENDILQEKEMQRQQALEQAQALAESERQRYEAQALSTKRLRRLVLALALVVLIAIGAAIVAVSQQRVAEAQKIIADEQRNEAETQKGIADEQRNEAEAQKVIADEQRVEAEEQRLIAESESRIASSRALAAASLTNLNTDPELSVLLALQAISVTQQANEPETLEAIEALHQAVQIARGRQTFRGHHTN